jgi:hypothetical protein
MDKIKKRGSVDVDWAISLAIFIIFLTIFFMFVFPMFSVKPPETNIIQAVKEKFENPGANGAAWTVSKVLIYVGNTNAGVYPVSLLLPYNFGTPNTSFPDNREFLIDENRIFFYHNLRNGSIYLVSSNSTYSQTKASGYDLSCTSSGFSVSSNFDVSVLNGLITKIDYNGETAALNFDYGGLESTSSTDFWNKTFVCKYKRGFHSTYVMGNYSMIFNYMGSENLNLKLDLEDGRYHSYYDSSAHTIPYNDNTCKSFSTDIIDLYDTDGIAFVSKDMSVTMCYSNATGEKLNLSMQLRNPYTIILHQGNYANITPYTGTRIELGALQTLTGLSYDKLVQLNQSRRTRYEELKSEWGISAVNEFDWRVSNKTLE